MSALNETSIQRAKEAIAAGKKLGAADPAPKTAPSKTGKQTPKKGSADADVHPAAKVKVDAALQKEAEAKAAAKAKEAADKKAAAEARATQQAKEKAERDAAKAKEKADKAAAYAAKIEQQKADTAARHRAEKLYNSFRARVKYMLYMDNPALGGLEGRENLGWVLSYTNSKGDVYAVERKGETIYVGAITLQPMATDLLEKAVLDAMTEQEWAA